VKGEGQVARLAGEAVLDLGAVAEDLLGGVELVQADGFLGGLVKQVLDNALLGLALEGVVHDLPGGAAEVVVLAGRHTLGGGGDYFQQFGFGEVLLLEGDAHASGLVRQYAVTEDHLAIAAAQGLALADYFLEFQCYFSHKIDPRFLYTTIYGDSLQ
jgi:hypothetical protein